jgi:hypothetical protein
MAILLIKAVNATHADPTKDLRGCYKRGDIVGVAPDDWTFGALEVLPPAQGGKFVRVQISDVTRQQVINWIRNNWQVEADGGDGTRRRVVRITVDSMPNNVRNQLNTTGFYSNTWANVRSFVQNKVTLAVASGPIGG